MQDKRGRFRPSGEQDGSLGIKKGDRLGSRLDRCNHHLARTQDFHHDSQAADICMPGPVYNWFCVAYSIVDVLSNAAAIRASQVYPRTATAAVQRNLKRRTTPTVDLNDTENVDSGHLIKDSPLNELGMMGDAHIGAFPVHPPDSWTYPIP